MKQTLSPAQRRAATRDRVKKEQALARQTASTRLGARLWSAGSKSIRSSRGRKEPFDVYCRILHAYTIIYVNIGFFSPTMAVQVVAANGGGEYAPPIASIEAKPDDLATLGCVASKLRGAGIDEPIKAAALSRRGAELRWGR